MPLQRLPDERHEPVAGYFDLRAVPRRKARTTSLSALCVPVRRDGCTQWGWPLDIDGKQFHPSASGAHTGAKFQHWLLTNRKIKEICDATGELARFSAPFSSVMPDLSIAGDEPHETNSPASGAAASRILSFGM